MAPLTRLLLSLLLATSCCLLVFGEPRIPTTRRRITKILYLSNGLDWGDWGEVQFCQDGSFAAYAEARYEPYGLLDADETALNGLILYCVDPTTNLPTGHISSTVGEKGELQGMRTCPSGFITAIQARVLEPQGTFGDDVAIQNFRLECDSSPTTITVVDESKNLKIPLGMWGDWSACDKGSAICGIETRNDPVDLVIDDASISDAILYCCLIDETTTPSS